MSVDMSQFHQVFFEESFEGLDIMESGLLNLDTGQVDDDEINSIFRAAHSIKGGSGTFGFNKVSDLTHLMETLLDEMRNHSRPVTQPSVAVLLGSVDCLRAMLTAIQQQQTLDEDNIARNTEALQAELKQPLLNHGQENTEPGTTELLTIPINNSVDQDTERVVPLENLEVEEDQVYQEVYGWDIAFSPHLNLFKTGNDPVRMLRELGKTGQVTTHVDFQGVPDFYDLYPAECHLSWGIQVVGDIPIEEIDEIFDWVTEDCDFAIQELTDLGAISQILNMSDPDFDGHGELPNTDPVVENEVEFLVEEKSDSAVKKNPVLRRNITQDSNPVAKHSSSVRVDTGKIDTLINMVGELVITQSMLSLIGEDFDMTKLDQLKNGLAQLTRHTRELQDGVMNIRMLPISFVFNRFPRLVYDLSSQLGKKIELELIGEHTEVDKTVVELLSDPLIHLVRNAIDHGIEMPEDRIEAGKSEAGTITLEAYHRGGNIVIEVKDDGRGLDKTTLIDKAIEKGLITREDKLTDKQAYELIFMPGFSTAAELSDISGRGVGMDVVRKNIQTLGGNIEILTQYQHGSSIIIHLPLTLAILDGQSIAVGDERYIIPLGAIIESVNVTKDMLNKVSGKGETFRLRDEYLPIIRIHEIFNVESSKVIEISDGLIVVVDSQGVRCGLFIDDLLGQQQVVIKSLEDNYRKVEGVSAATILGDGSVALILDIPGLVRLANQ